MNCTTDPAETIYFRSSRNFSQWSALRSNWINKNSKSLLPQKHFTLRFSFFYSSSTFWSFSFPCLPFPLEEAFWSCVMRCEMRIDGIIRRWRKSKRRDLSFDNKSTEIYVKKHCWFVLENRRNLLSLRFLRIWLSWRSYRKVLKNLQEEMIFFWLSNKKNNKILNLNLNY